MICFENRFNDIHVPIRLECVKFASHCLMNHPDLAKDLTGNNKSNLSRTWNPSQFFCSLICNKIRLLFFCGFKKLQDVFEWLVFYKFERVPCCPATEFISITSLPCRGERDQQNEVNSYNCCQKYYSKLHLVIGI